MRPGVCGQLIFDTNWVQIGQVSTNDGPVFKKIERNNEKTKQSVLYRGATQWNGLGANVRYYEIL